jgi:hypothetical protein
VDPEGTVVATDDLAASQPDTAEWVLLDPAVGGWTVRVTQTKGLDAGAVEIGVGLLQTTDTNPDPVEALGYEQREYETTPLTFFEEYGPYADAPVDPVSVDGVAGGTLRSDGELAYQNLVVIHDDGSDNADYIEAIDEFVAEGGNLVLTDTGVNLLGELRTGVVSDIGADAISEETFVAANLESKELDHELLDGARPIQRELYKATALGYAGSELPPNPQVITTAEAPATLVDEGAFTDSGGTIAGRAKDRVAAGSIDAPTEGAGGIHVIGGLLPPGNQAHLHPFGLRDYAVSFLGHTMVSNALGYRQQRFVDGELTVEFGDLD